MNMYTFQQDCHRSLLQLQRDLNVRQLVKEICRICSNACKPVEFKCILYVLLYQKSVFFKKADLAHHYYIDSMQNRRYQIDSNILSLLMRQMGSQTIFYSPFSTYLNKHVIKIMLRDSSLNWPPLSRSMCCVGWRPSMGIFRKKMRTNQKATLAFFPPTCTFPCQCCQLFYQIPKKILVIRVKDSKLLIF